MSYKRTPFKMAPKSPLTKALKGNQGKLPQQLQEAIKAAPESPAKAMMGPDVQKEASKTGTAGANSAKGANAKTPQRSYAPGTNQSKFNPAEVKPTAKATPAPTAKPKYDKELNTLVAARKGLKKGTSEYNTIQNQINAKLGSKKVHGRGTATKTSVSTKTPKMELATAAAAADTKIASSRGLTPKPAAKKPAASKAPSQADKFEKVLAKESAKAPMGSETRSKAPTSKAPAAKKPAAKKPEAKKTVGQKVKGTVRKARLAQLDRKANRQAAKAADKKSKGAGKLSGLGK